MNELIHEHGLMTALLSLVVNFVWSSLNLRLLHAMEKKFVTKEQFHASNALHILRHKELSGRLERAGA